MSINDYEGDRMTGDRVPTSWKTSKDALAAELRTNAPKLSAGDFSVWHSDDSHVQYVRMLDGRAQVLVEVERVGSTWGATGMSSCNGARDL